MRTKLVTFVFLALAAMLGPSIPGASARSMLGNKHASSLIQVLQTANVPKPKWYPQFSVEFNETTRIFFTKQTSGTWWYDAPSGQEAIYRKNGNGDRYCGSVHPFTQTACTHLVTEGRRFLIFPDINDCCMCCTAEQGCGIVSPSWLDNASFEGTVDLRGVAAYKWRRDGLQENDWFTMADEDQRPLELDQRPNDLMYFDPASFTVGQPSQEFFLLPDICTKPTIRKCPLTSVCTIAGQRKESF